MASLNLFVSPVVFTQQRRVSTAATAAKSSGVSSAEKGPFDWILKGLTKEDQLVETDPILKKVEEKTSGISGTTSRKGTTSVTAPVKKKNGGFGLGGLFAKE